MNNKSAGSVFSIKLPEFRKAKIELWKFLNMNDMDALLSCFEGSAENTETNKSGPIQYKSFSHLISIQLKLDPKKNKKDAILIDQYYYLIKFSLNNSFEKVQINCILSILNRTHQLAIETSFGNLNETFEYFKDLLKVTSVHRPPFSLKIFSPKQIQSIIDYFFNTYFKQFKFYKYAFSTALKLDLKLNYSNLSIEEKKVSTPNEQVHQIQEENEEVKLEESQPILAANEQEQNDELRMFIRNYLGHKIDHLKNEISAELDEAPLRSNETKTPTKLKK